MNAKQLYINGYFPNVRFNLYGLWNTSMYYVYSFGRPIVKITTVVQNGTKITTKKEIWKPFAGLLPFKFTDNQLGSKSKWYWGSKLQRTSLLMNSGEYSPIKTELYVDRSKNNNI